MNRIFYYNGKEILMDVLYFKLFKSTKVDNNLLKMIEKFNNKEMPIMPIKASTLIEKYNIPKGKELGIKLREIEEIWADNNFQISDKEFKDIVNN